MKLFTNKRGTSVVEFAIILPVLMVIVFGIIEFGILFYNKAVITNASREGARFGIVQANVRPTLSDITAVVNSYCSNNLLFGSTTLPAVSAPDAPCAAFGNDLTVTANDFLKHRYKASA